MLERFALIVGVLLAAAPTQASVITVALNSFTFPGGNANTLLESSFSFSVPRFNSSLGVPGSRLDVVHRPPASVVVQVTDRAAAISSAPWSRRGIPAVRSRPAGPRPGPVGPGAGGRRCS
jgi:hypothetical protein